MFKAVGVGVAEVLIEIGGVASRAMLLEASPRADVDNALRVGEIVCDTRGRYALPSTSEAVRAAHSLSGVLSHSSAALFHGWEVKFAPDLPHVTVPTKRKVSAERRRTVNLHRGDLHPDDVDGLATTAEKTLEQCLRALPFDEALAVADSALRHDIAPSLLKRVATSARGPGSPQIRRVVALARMDVANPFESALRAIALDVAGLNAVPQRVLPGTDMRPDLVDEDLRIVLEADSFEWHGDRAALRADAQRYNAMVVDGWLVLRFAWEDVMFDAAYVRSTLQALVQRRSEVAHCQCAHA